MSNNRESMKSRGQVALKKTVDEIVGEERRVSFVELLSLHREIASELGPFLGTMMNDTMHNCLTQVEMLLKTLPHKSK